MPTLTDCLRALKKTELYDLGFRLQVTPCRSGAKKQAWIDRLLPAYEEIDKLRHCLGLHNLTRLEALLSRCLPQVDGSLLAQPVSTDLPLLQRLRLLGLALRQGDSWHLAPQAADLPLMGVEERLFLKGEEALYARQLSCLVFRPLMEPEDMAQRMEALLKQAAAGESDGVTPVLEPRLAALLLRARPHPELLMAWRNGLNGVAFVTEEDRRLLMYPELHDAQRVWDMCGTLEVGNLPWVEPDADQLPYLQQWHTTSQAVAGLLKAAEAADLLEEPGFPAAVRTAVDTLQLGDRSGAYQVLENVFTPLPEDALTPAQELVLQDFLDAVPLWRNRGRCDRALRQELWGQSDFGALCPCGSGRLYRHCHGRVN